MAEDDFRKQDEATLRQGSLEVRVTIDDANEMRALLLDALEKSDLGDKDVLVAMTEPLPAWIDSDGRVMIGGWMLQLRGGRVVASYQLSRNEERAVGYAASFFRSEGRWLLLEIVPEKIRFGR